MPGYIVYIISISLQIAGAIILLKFGSSTRKEDILQRAFGKTFATIEKNQIK